MRAGAGMDATGGPVVGATPAGSGGMAATAPTGGGGGTRGCDGAGGVAAEDSLLCGGGGVAFDPSDEEDAEETTRTLPDADGASSVPKLLTALGLVGSVLASTGDVGVEAAEGGCDCDCDGGC